jgi:hypothetical protein
MTSWVIVNKNTGMVVFETFKKETAEKCRDIDGYRVVPIMEWLCSLNITI